jgi:aspartate 1-decarboxylase
LARTCVNQPSLTKIQGIVSRLLSLSPLPWTSNGEKCKRKLDHPQVKRFPCAVLRQVLISKLHRAMITSADVEYEGSIEIPTDLMEVIGLWAGEKVLVASITTGNRLETYVQPGPPGTGNIIINGGAAHLIKKGERVAIMAFGLTDKPIAARKVVLDEKNHVIRGGR